MSLLLKILSFLAFQTYQRIHGKASKISFVAPKSFALQRRKSKFVKIDVLGKMPGLVGILDKAQTCIAGGHSKRRCFIDSETPPHLIHVRSDPQCRSTSLLEVARHPERACQRKCLIFLAVFTFHTCFLRIFVLGSVTSFSSSFHCVARRYPDFTV